MLFWREMPGLFITFEGLDGSGKSTHLKRAAAWLGERGISCRATHEPGGTPLGDAIRQVFLDPRWGQMDGVVELLLVFASRRQHLLELIEPALAAGIHVLCDRFTDSTLAYQGCGRGVPRERILEIDRQATGGRRPDRTLLFDLPPDLARARGHSPRRQGRGSADRLDAEDLAFYGRVRDGFLALAADDPARFVLVDSSRHPADTFAQVAQALAGIFGLPPEPPPAGRPEREVPA
jgi:dTMP kinase